MNPNDEFGKSLKDTAIDRKIAEMPLDTPQRIVEALRLLLGASDKERAHRYAEDTLMPTLEMLRQTQRTAVEAYDPEINRLRQQINANRTRPK